jgi:acyl carrier protein
MPPDLHARTARMVDGLFASEVSSCERAMASGSADNGPAPIATRPRGGDASALAQIATSLRSVGEIAGAHHASRASRTARPDGDRVAAAAVAPTTDIEIALAKIWEEVIGVPVADVSQDLFALGGDSLLAVRILGRMHETFQIELSLDDLFLGPLTVQGVAVAVERAMVSPVAPSIS